MIVTLRPWLQVHSSPSLNLSILALSHTSTHAPSLQPPVAPLTQSSLLVLPRRQRQPALSRRIINPYLDLGSLVSSIKQSHLLYHLATAPWIAGTTCHRLMDRTMQSAA